MKGEFTKESSKLTLCLQNSYRMAKVLCIPENVFVLVSFHIKDLNWFASDRDFIVHRQTVRKSDRTLNRKTTLAATSRLLMRPADKLLRTAGKLRLPSGAIYHGEWQLGLRHGDGAPCSSCCINSCSPATRGRENSILICIWLSRANPADSQSRRALPPYLLQACLQGNQRTSAATSTTATGAWTFAAAMVTRPHWDPFRRLKSYSDSKDDAFKKS